MFIVRQSIDKVKYNKVFVSSRWSNTFYLFFPSFLLSFFFFIRFLFVFFFFFRFISTANMLLFFSSRSTRNGLRMVFRDTIEFCLSCMNIVRGQETPYVMMHYEKNYTGNSRFYGFCVDLLEAVAREVGFSYRLDLVPDRKYGARDPETGEWNGIVRELMRHVWFGLFNLLDFDFHSIYPFDRSHLSFSYPLNSFKFTSFFIFFISFISRNSSPNE